MIPCRSARRTGCAVLAAALLAACAVGPNFKAAGPLPRIAGICRRIRPRRRRPAPVAGGEAQRFLAAQDIPGEWWTLFQSAEMNELLEAALQHNPTLEAAQAALRQANENVAAERGAFFPSLTGTYQGQRADASLASFGLPGSGNYLYTLNSASVNVAYTLDVFGGIRRQVEALQAQADYERSSLEASYLALTANVVTAAVTEASLRAQVEVTEEVARSQRAQLDITQRRVTAGGASRADVLAAAGGRCRRRSRRCRHCAPSSPRSGTCSPPTWERSPRALRAARSSSTPCIYRRIYR